MLPVKRRLSAPGRRKSVGIELKPDKLISSKPCSSSGKENVERIPSLQGIGLEDRPLKIEYSKLNTGESNIQGSYKVKASGRESRKALKAKVVPRQNFRAPVREAKEGEVLQGYTCSDCAKFAALLRSENVPSSIIEAASKHKYFCAPSSTPPNIWEPWTIDSYVSTCDD